ncbi:MAG: hypothetical protein HWE24_19535 [Oceanospirillaceae bacterium]|nr:hypothetical protein [Oceanospirillaceae bacterium]
MFKRIMLRFRDMKTISKLISGAEEQAHINGKEEPGAEHFVLSALNLDDGSAKRVFERMDANAEKFKSAISQQYTDALSSIGFDNVNEISSEAIQSNKIFHTSQPSGQTLVKSLYTLKQRDKHRPLLGVHVISVASEMEYGVVARAFRAMGVDSKQLARLIKEELESQH